MKPEYRCKYCGAPSWVHPLDQEPPPDYCHESDHGEPPEPEQPRAIDLTPTWGEIGRIYLQLVQDGNQAPLEGMRTEVARAFAFAQFVTEVHSVLPEVLKNKLSEVVCRELTKMGY